MTDQEQKMLQAGIDAYAQKLNEANSALQVAVKGFNALAGIANQEQDQEQSNGKVETNADIILRLRWQIRSLKASNERLVREMDSEDYIMVVDEDGSKQPLWAQRLRNRQPVFEGEGVFRLA